MSLDELALGFGTDKASNGHDYARWYERHLDYLGTQRGVVLAEIGVLTGASVRMWACWFPAAQVIGVDLDLSQVRDPESMPANVRLVQHDATKWEAPPNSLDVLIDDGSHQALEITDTLTRYWPAIKPGGWLCVEDWATQTEEFYGGSETGSKALTAAHRWLDKTLMPAADDVSELHAYTELIMIRRAE